MTSNVGKDLIASTVINGGVSVAAFESLADLPLGIALNRTRLLFFLATATRRKYFNAIKLLGQSK